MATPSRGVGLAMANAAPVTTSASPDEKAFVEKDMGIGLIIGIVVLVLLLFLIVVFWRRRAEPKERGAGDLAWVVYKPAASE